MNIGYTLRCTSCGKSISDDNLPLRCDCGTPALLRAEYTEKQLNPGPDSLGLYKFAGWLPIRRTLDGSAPPVTYRSEELAKRLGLSRLYITFSGYWPERECRMKTGTFKECEAFSVCARMPEGFEKTLVVASAGNTARSFARVCSTNRIPLVVVVPETSLDAMWFDEEIDPCVRLIAAGGRSDYFDAIHLSSLICGFDGYMPEGGAKNVARRDGMGTTVLSAAVEIGEVPEYYFQAVGSGTGAIAAWEANLRLLADGRFGENKMKLMISQNAPFLPLYDSWKERRRELVELDLDTASKQIEEIKAKVLSNRKPPYSLTGGLYDALVDSGGEVFAATNLESDEARQLFLETEGIDISPAAGVALASLVQASKSGLVGKEALVMLNITGGGVERFKLEKPTRYLEPSAVIPQEQIVQEDLEVIAKALDE
jgi:cysteate synthase